MRLTANQLEGFSAPAVDADHSNIVRSVVAQLNRDDVRGLLRHSGAEIEQASPEVFGLLRDAVGDPRAWLDARPSALAALRASISGSGTDAARAATTAARTLRGTDDDAWRTTPTVEVDGEPVYVVPVETRDICPVDVARWLGAADVASHLPVVRAAIALIADAAPQYLDWSSPSRALGRADLARPSPRPKHHPTDRTVTMSQTDAAELLRLIAESVELNHEAAGSPDVASWVAIGTRLELDFSADDLVALAAELTEQPVDESNAVEAMLAYGADEQDVVAFGAPTLSFSPQLFTRLNTSFNPGLRTGTITFPPEFIKGSSKPFGSSV